MSKIWGVALPDFKNHHSRSNSLKVVRFQRRQVRLRHFTDTIL